MTRPTTAIDQVKSGLKLVAIVVGVLVGFIALAGGIAIAKGMAHGATWQQHRSIGVLIIATVVAVLAATVERWAAWFFGFAAFTAFKGLIILLTGRYWTGPVDRWYALAILGIFAALVYLTFPFTDRKPRGLFEKVGLVSAVISVCWSVVDNSMLPFLLPVLILVIGQLQPQAGRDSN